MRKSIIGTTNSEDWILRQLKIGSAKQELKDGTRKPEDYKVFLTLQDEKNIRQQECKNRAALNHKKMLDEVYAIKDKEMADKRERFMKTGKYD